MSNDDSEPQDEESGLEKTAKDEWSCKTINVRPTRVRITPDMIEIRHPKLVGENTTTVPLKRPSAVEVKTGLRPWKAKVVFRGDPDVEVDDLSSKAAKEIRDLVERLRR